MFANIDNKYRPIPFWSWNEKLDTGETKRQIAMMEAVGIGGFFMHARGGLQTEYMGEDWFSNISVSIEEGKKRGMYAWAYDENGWPSGFGNGLVSELGVEFQQKYLRFSEGEKNTGNTICNKDGFNFYYEINPFYVDVLDSKVTKEFIKKVYEPYYEKYKTEIEGFFTDEPQISTLGIPWSFILPEEYKKEYNDDLLLHLIELFRPVGDYEITRIRFWKLVTKLFSKNFMKEIYDWCACRDLKFTGHLMCEESLQSQLTTNGACMPHFEYFHIPGMDWLGRPIFKCLTPLQVSSVAHQFGKKQILSETFAMCGHNVGHGELKGIFEWQMVNGITLLCQHLQGYSMRGIRKRDYPPAMFYQQPWWEDYRIFNDSMSRIGMILSEGKVEYDTLLIHPQTSAWVCFDNDKNEGLKELNDGLLDVMETLDKKHILYHFGDEIIMERHAKVEGDTLVIGKQRYKTIVLPPHKKLLENTKCLLEEFENNGGKIVSADAVQKNPIVDCEVIQHTKRIFDKFSVYYFVNSTKETYRTKINVGSKIMDIKTGAVYPFSGEYTFKGFESLIVIEDGEERTLTKEEKNLNTLDLSGEWRIKSCTHNCLTLDKCDYYFDNELIEENGYVLNIQERACSLKRAVNIKCEYKLNLEYVPSEIYLVCETPEIYEIFVNGKSIDKNIEGYFIDFSFKKINISNSLKKGENIITLATEFKQSDKVYENIQKAKIFETEKNKLTYDMEIEPIYIAGNFSVKCDNGFIISNPKNAIMLNNINKQGFPFFAGSITLEKSFNLTEKNYKINFTKQGINSVKIKVNEKEVPVIMWEPYEPDISEFTKKGENKIEITLRNNLRNMLGPHHSKKGELYSVGPWNFYKEPSVWNGYKENENWDDEYCFVNVGLEK